MLLVGKPGSGKTHMIKELLTRSDLYANMFDLVLIISPSVKKMGITTARERTASEYSLDWIASHIKKANAIQRKRMIDIIRL
jgi:hypothetical protein